MRSLFKNNFLHCVFMMIASKLRKQIYFLSLLTFCFTTAFAAEVPICIQKIVLEPPNCTEELSDFSSSELIVHPHLDMPNARQLKCMLHPFFHAKITLDELNKLTRCIENYYIDSGYPLVSAKLLANQDITDGVIHVTLLLGRLNCIKSKGACYFSNKQIASMIKTRPGAVIRSCNMERDIYWINNHPFRRTQLIYEKGPCVGDVDVVLETKDRLPFRPYVGYENTGNKIAGRSRYFVGFNWGNVWGLDHQLNYRYTRATVRHHYWAHAGSYTFPLPWRHILKAFATYTQTEPHMEHKLHSTGKGWEFRGRYEVPFCYPWRPQHFYLGYDFKRTNNFLTFVKSLVFNSYIDISQFPLGYFYTVDWPWTTGHFEAKAVMSPGHMTKYNRGRYFKQERKGAHSRYLYGWVDLQLNTPLCWDLCWKFVGRGQYSAQKLMPSEEFSVGGYSTVRGYLENQYIGDSGFLVKNELHLPKLTLGKCPKKGLGTLRFLAFFDYGRVYEADPNIKKRTGSSLYSVGPGFRYFWGDHMDVWLDYGFQLKKARKSSEPGSSRLHVGATLSF